MILEQVIIDNKRNLKINIIFQSILISLMILCFTLGYSVFLKIFGKLVFRELLVITYLPLTCIVGLNIIETINYITKAKEINNVKKKQLTSVINELNEKVLSLEKLKTNNVVINDLKEDKTFINQNDNIFFNNNFNEKEQTRQLVKRYRRK